jgi:hypothetical protein
LNPYDHLTFKISNSLFQIFGVDFLGVNYVLVYILWVYIFSNDAKFSTHIAIFYLKSHLFSKKKIEKYKLTKKYPNIWNKMF